MHVPLSGGLGTGGLHSIAPATPSGRVAGARPDAHAGTHRPVHTNTRASARYAQRHGRTRMQTTRPAQARLRSQKSRQNNCSTPNPCLDKALHARVTHNPKARAGLKPCTASYNAHATFQSLPVLIHCRGHQVPWNRSPFQPSASS